MGTILASGFGEAEFVTTGPDGSTRRRYGGFDRLRVEGECVVIRPRATRIDFYYPGSLFPPDALERFVAAGVASRGLQDARRRVGDARIS